MTVQKRFRNFASNQSIHEMENPTYCIQTNEEETLSLPSFTFSVSTAIAKPAPVWVKPKDAADFLNGHGYRVCTQTLLNMEKDGRLHPRRTGLRRVEFDLNEIKALIKS